MLQPGGLLIEFERRRHSPHRHTADSSGCLKQSFGEKRHSKQKKNGWTIGFGLCPSECTSSSAALAAGNAGDTQEGTTPKFVTNHSMLQGEYPLAEDSIAALGVVASVIPRNQPAACHLNSQLVPRYRQLPNIQSIELCTDSSSCLCRFHVSCRQGIPQSINRMRGAPHPNLEHPDPVRHSSGS